MFAKVLSHPEAYFPPEVAGGNESQGLTAEREAYMEEYLAKARTLMTAEEQVRAPECLT